MKTKNEIRKEISSLARVILPEDDYRIIHSIDICKKILATEEYKNTNVILAYMALPDEVNLSNVIVDSFVAEKKVYVPRLDDKNGNMTFHQITAEIKLEENSFKILEPPENSSVIDLDSFLGNSSVDVLMLVPGRAFTKGGKRLGRGGGYYDRFLQKYKKYENRIKKIGVCFPFQILSELPTEPDDCTVDKIIYE